VRASLKEAMRDGTIDLAVVTVGDTLAECGAIYRECLESGLNVISSGVEASFPYAVSSDAAREIDNLAKQFDVTFTGSGFQDVFRLGLAKTLSGATSDIDAIRHYSLVDIQHHGPAAARTAGAGLTLEEFKTLTDQRASRAIPAYQIFAHHTAASLGITVKSIECTMQPVVGIEGLTIGSSFVTKVISDGSVNLYATNELRVLSPGEEEYLEWKLEGPSPVTARVSGIDTLAATIAQIVNRMPDVLEAQSGLVTVDRLPPIRWRTSVDV
jgi:hypothetical protein